MLTKLQRLGERHGVAADAGVVDPGLAFGIGALGLAAVVGEGVDGDAAARVEDAEDFEVARRQGFDQIIEDDVDHVLVEVAAVAEAAEVELEGFRLDHLGIGHVADQDRRPVGLAGDRAEAGELHALQQCPVVALRVLVGEDLQQLGVVAVRVGCGAAEGGQFGARGGRFLGGLGHGRRPLSGKSGLTRSREEREVKSIFLVIHLSPVKENHPYPQMHADVRR